MKLYNRTHCPDEALTALLVKAGMAVGARTFGVVVKVAQGRRPYSSGEAWKCAWVRPELRIKRGTSKQVGMRKIATDGGYFRIVLPAPERFSTCEIVPMAANDPLEMALSFWRIARHEWGHIRENQSGDYWRLERARRGPSGRRPAHDTRPEEERAEAMCDDADATGRDEEWAREEILALAIVLEDAKR